MKWYKTGKHSYLSADEQYAIIKHGKMWILYLNTKPALTPINYCWTLKEAKNGL